MPSLRFANILSFTLLIALLVSAQEGAAQVFNKTNNQNGITDNQKIISDSATGFAEKGLDYSVTIFYLDRQGLKKQYDTTIYSMHQIGLMADWDVSLGNTGSAYQSLKAQADLPDRYTLLPTNWNAYRFDPAEVKFYNTTKPFSAVRYVSGSKQEQILELFHTQNITPLWNFSTNYRKINSLGFYNAQKNNIDNYSFVSSYTTKNQRYRAKGAFLYNKLQQDENLGLLSDTFLTKPEYSNHAIIPVGVGLPSTTTRSTLLNYRRDVNVNFSQDYSIGKTSIHYDEDSLKQTLFKPILTFSNSIYYRAERYCFINSSADTAFNKIFQANYLNEPFTLDDTLNVRYDNNTIGTNFGAEGNVYLGSNVFSVLGGLGFEYQKIGGFAAEQSAVNNYIFGELTNRKSQDSSWQLNAQLRLYYTGMAKGNLNFRGDLSKALPRNLGTIGIGLGQYIQQPFYIAESIQVNKNERTKSLKSQVNTVLGGYYKNEKLRFKASVHSLLFNQLIYSQGLQPDYQNYASAISIQQIELAKEFHFGHWVSSNTLLLQLVPDNTPIQLPLFASRHRFAYNNYLFDSKLEISTGLDFTYNTSFYNDVYQTVFQSFNPQQTIQQVFVPRLTPFFNFRVKRFRASLSFDQAQHFFVKNNLNYINHASQNQTFRFGLRWIFVN